MRIVGLIHNSTANPVAFDWRKACRIVAIEELDSNMFWDEIPLSRGLQCADSIP